MAADSESCVKVISVWDHDETLALVAAWSRDDIQAQLKRSVRNLKVYMRISELMAAAGYLKTAVQCRHKMKKLQYEYRQVKYCHLRAPGRHKAFKYFKLLDNILKDRPLAPPKAVLHALSFEADPEECVVPPAAAACLLYSPSPDSLSPASLPGQGPGPSLEESSGTLPTRTSSADSPLTLSGPGASPQLPGLHADSTPVRSKGDVTGEVIDKPSTSSSSGDEYRYGAEERPRGTNLHGKKKCKKGDTGNVLYDYMICQQEMQRRYLEFEAEQRRLDREAAERRDMCFMEMMGALISTVAMAVNRTNNNQN
ncbi:uncharacterized protein [Heptranchias perlo]|uniref:uncharacterized protein isoform X2 n=1 Tax=Heptranchias perlo TaxID=212740 RepID=UPI003559C62C